MMIPKQRPSLRIMCAALAFCSAGWLAAQESEKRGHEFGTALAEAAIERTLHAVRYDGSYYAIDYPNGDVPASIGVCTDVVVRSYRALGFDLQVAVHEDMKVAFNRYPQIWGLKAPDTNIDHRRVANLERFFERQGAALPGGDDPSLYLAGDVVSWMLPGNLPHIGIVTERFSADGRRPMIVHNIGNGPRMEDVLFRYPIQGHFRFRVRENEPAPDLADP